MPTRIEFRKAVQDAMTDENPIVLVTITHSLLNEPLRLSTDPTIRLSTDPLEYGTRSKLIGSTAGELVSAEEFLFVLMAAVLPEDRERGVTATDITFENVDSGMIDLVRRMRTPARVDFAVVLAATPDYVDFEWTDLRTIAVDYDDASISISISREDQMNVAWPFGHMTKSRFPGQHR